MENHIDIMDNQNQRDREQLINDLGRRMDELFRLARENVQQIAQIQEQMREVADNRAQVRTQISEIAKFVHEQAVGGPLMLKRIQDLERDLGGVKGAVEDLQSTWQRIAGGAAAVSVAWAIFGDVIKNKLGIP